MRQGVRPLAGHGVRHLPSRGDQCLSGVGHLPNVAMGASSWTPATKVLKGGLPIGNWTLIRHYGLLERDPHECRRGIVLRTPRLAPKASGQRSSAGTRGGCANLAQIWSSAFRGGLACRRADPVAMRRQRVEDPARIGRSASLAQTGQHGRRCWVEMARAPGTASTAGVLRCQRS